METIVTGELTGIHFPVGKDPWCVGFTILIEGESDTKNYQVVFSNLADDHLASLTIDGESITFRDLLLKLTEANYLVKVFLPPKNSYKTCNKAELTTRKET